MCMKNINTDVVFFDTIEYFSDSEKLNLCSAYLKYPTILAQSTENEGELVIPKLSVLLSINATERIVDGKVKHFSDETNDNTFFFDDEYELRLRVTETQSGRFVDLGDVFISPKEKGSYVQLDRNIYNKKIVCCFSNVRVSKPGKCLDSCVLKILVRRKVESEEPNKWYVQSSHPMILEIE